MKLPATLTFRRLDEQQGVRLAEPLPQDWPLEKWFASVYDLPIDRFTIFDLARSCRQQLYPEAVVPYCIRALSFIPLAGELYEGELLHAVLELPPDYWQAHLEERDAVLSAAEAAGRETDDAELRVEIEAWVAAFQAPE